MTDFTIGQFSRYVRSRYDRRIYAFCLYIDAKQEVLEEIDEVLYTLHPTFPEPVRRHRNVETCFALQSDAWGTFPSTCEVHWKDGRVDLLGYQLDLNENAWPMGARPVDFQSPKEKLLYEALFHPEVEWRKVSTLARRASITESEANQFLQSLASRKVARKAYYQSIDKEDLWGSTSVVGLLPRPRQ
jgi:transcription initiation factor IIF auxiliary subunit